MNNIYIIDDLGCSYRRRKRKNYCRNEFYPFLVDIVIVCTATHLHHYYFLLYIEGKTVVQLLHLVHKLCEIITRLDCF